MMLFYCSSCTSPYNICDFTVLNSCMSCKQLVLTNTKIPENMKLLPMKQEIVYRSRKLFCENCACCAHRVQIPHGYCKIGFPQAGSAEERELLLSISLRLINRNDDLERQRFRSDEKQAIMGRELRQLKNSNEELLRTNKILEKQFDEHILEMMNDEEEESKLRHNNEISQLREARDEYLLENATLRDELNSVKDQCSMLLRREKQVEDILAIINNDIAGGKYSIEGSIKQLNKVEIAVVPKSAGRRPVEKNRRSSVPSYSQNYNNRDKKMYSDLEREMEKLMSSSSSSPSSEDELYAQIGVETNS